MTVQRSVVAALLALGCGLLESGPQPSPARLPVAVASERVGEDADDPAIWVNRANPAASRVIGTNKKAAPTGAVVVFDLAGRIVQRVEGLDRPNNVDVEYGFRLGTETVDIAVATERYQRRLKAWRIRPDGTLEDVSSPEGLTVFTGERGERGAPMGIALYRRPADGAVFAIVSRKQGPTSGYLWQYRLEDDGRGRVRARKVRELGEVRSGNEVEAVAVDDPLGVVYYAEERRGIHEWAADPDSAAAGRELSLFGTEGFLGDREGIAVFARPGGTGYVLCTDQVRGPSRYLVFRREGGKGSPHDHHEVVRVLEGGGDATDGLDATSEALPGFPHGLIVAMNSVGRNFLFYRAEQLGLE
jgi:3-phytase